MCDKAVNAFVTTVALVLDMFITNKMLETLDGCILK